MGAEVRLVKGDKTNMKLTTKEDVASLASSSNRLLGWAWAMTCTA